MHPLVGQHVSALVRSLRVLDRLPTIYDYGPPSPVKRRAPAEVLAPGLTVPAGQAEADRTGNQALFGILDLLFRVVLVTRAPGKEPVGSREEVMGEGAGEAGRLQGLGEQAAGRPGAGVRDVLGLEPIPL
ncbi:hypothetical protein [Streptomyces sp. ME19-01-6]|uniref:hypothetical protein n=1 Tax=Streptomyces sp. ME19-01-6 TaxID=3028686 RepID=UPI0029B5E318|nr:hypothetical protein [Streptomyces sp. ME19-01-6]MDX3227741.1 hypothetical protein [Streptomyces sp. ME19-01-6]